MYGGESLRQNGGGGAAAATSAPAQVEPTLEQEPEQESKQAYTFDIYYFFDLRRIFEDNLPLESLREMPNDIMMSFGTMAYIIFFGCFMFFLVDSFIKGLDYSYISLDINAGQCEEVERSLTGTYFGSDSGLWQGDGNFLYHDAVYRFDFNDLRVDDSRFQRLIAEDFDIAELRTYFKEHDLASNLIAWMHYKQERNVNGKFQQMSLLSTPNDIFDRRLYSATVIGNNFSRCEAEDVNFQAAAGKFRLDFPSSDLCKDLLLQVSSGGFTTAGGEIPIKVDVNTFSVVAALNLGILQLKDLELIRSIGFITLFFVEYELKELLDPRYPRSALIYCVTSDDPDAITPQLCFQEVGEFQGALPILMHYNPLCASCSETSSVCKQFDLTAALVYTNSSFFEGSGLASNGDYQFSGLEFLLLLYLLVAPDDFKLYLSLSISQDFPAFFDACPHCRIMFVRLLDEDVRTVTAFGHRLKAGHCDSYLDSSSFRALAEDPPVELTERFYECKDSTFDAFINAVGVAFGNMEVFGTIALMLLLLVAFAVASRKSVKASFEERHDTAETSESKDVSEEDITDCTRRLRQLHQKQQKEASEGQQQVDVDSRYVQQLMATKQLTRADIDFALLLKHALHPEETDSSTFVTATASAVSSKVVKSGKSPKFKKTQTANAISDASSSKSGNRSRKKSDDSNLQVQQQQQGDSELIPNWYCLG